MVAPIFSEFEDFDFQGYTIYKAKCACGKSGYRNGCFVVEKIKSKKNLTAKKRKIYDSDSQTISLKQAIILIELKAFTNDLEYFDSAIKTFAV